MDALLLQSLINGLHFNGAVSLLSIIIGYLLLDMRKMMMILFLIIHDNGGRNRASQLRIISYEQTKSILTFVK